MSSSTKIAGSLIVIAVAGYAAATWHIGSRIQSQMDSNYAALAKYSAVFSIEREYQRGFLSSKEIIRMRMPEEMTELLDFPVEFETRTAIQHGPFPGFSSVAAATAHSETLLTENTKQKFKELLAADQVTFITDSAAVATSDMVFDFSGNGTGTFSVPTFSVEAGPSTEQTHMKFKGMQGEARFHADLSNISATSHSDGITLTIGDSLLEISTITFSSDQYKPLPADYPSFYLGKQNITMNSIVFKPGDVFDTGLPFSFDKLSVAMDMNESGDFFDLRPQIRFDRFTLDDMPFTNGIIDIVLSHLHTRSFAEMAKIFSEIGIQNPEILEYEPMAVFEPVQAQLRQLLLQGIEFRIDQLAVSTANGSASATAKLAFDNPQDKDFSSSSLLLKKINLTAEGSAAIAFIHDLVKMTAYSEEEAELAIQDIDVQLQEMQESGFIVIDNDTVRSKMELRNGESRINGKPINL